MDWPTATVLIVCAICALIAYWLRLEDEGTNCDAIGFHVGHIGGDDGCED